MTLGGTCIQLQTWTHGVLSVGTLHVRVEVFARSCLNVCIDKIASQGRCAVFVFR